MNSKIRNLIINTLSSLNLPCTYMKYEGTDNTYITFFEYLGQTASSSEDEEDNAEHFIQLNLYYKDDIGDLDEDIMKLLTAQGMTKNYIKDLGYDDGTQRYWTAICVYYLENKK